MRKILLHDNTELASVKSITFKESVNADKDLRPGTVCSASIEVEAFGNQASAVPSGEELRYYRDNVLIGTFYAEPSIATKNSYRFTAYDNASKLDTDFTEWLTSHQSDFPMALSALVSAACQVAGVTLTGTVPFATMQVQAFYSDSITCRDILSYVAEIGCKFVKCDPNGNIAFGWFAVNNSYQIYPYADDSGEVDRVAYKQDGLQYANYETQLIDGVAIHPPGEDDVVYIYPQAASGNLLHITNNILLTGADETLHLSVAEEIYNGIRLISQYRPMEAHLFPSENPFRAGDIVNVRDIQGVSFTSPVMALTVTASEALLTADGSETYTAKENTQKAVRQLASDIVRFNKVKIGWADVDELFAREISVTGSLHSDDYDPGVLYADKGLGIDFANRLMQSQYFAVSPEGKLYAKGGEIGGFAINYSESKIQNMPATIDRCEDENGNAVGYSGYTIESDGYMYYNAVQSKFTPGGTAYWLYGPRVAVTKGDTEDTTFTVRAIYYSGSTQTGYEDFTFEYGASYVGNIYLIELPSSMVKSSDSVVFRIALKGGDYCRLYPQWVYALSSLAAGTDSLGGDESSVYIGTDGISFGKDILTTAFIKEVGQYIYDPSNVWNYRKWSDGHLEMEQALTNRGSLPIATATGNIYCSASQYIAVPPMFTSVEHFAISGYHSVAFAWVTSWLSTDGQTVGYRLLSAESASTGNQNVSIRLTGRWD